MVNNTAVNTGVYASFQTVFSFRYMLRKGIAGSYSSYTFSFLSFFLILFSIVAIVVHLLNHVWLFATSWTTICQGLLSFTIFLSLLKFMSIESVILSNHLILCCPRLLLHSVFPSIIVFSSQSALHIWWPKYWSLSFSISLFSEYSGLNSFGIDWFDLLAVQGTLKP